jgi:hypothetical protein
MKLKAVINIANVFIKAISGSRGSRSGRQKILRFTDSTEEQKSYEVKWRLF